MYSESPYLTDERDPRQQQQTRMLAVAGCAILVVACIVAAIASLTSGDETTKAEPVAAKKSLKSVEEKVQEPAPAPAADTADADTTPASTSTSTLDPTRRTSASYVPPDRDVAVDTISQCTSFGLDGTDNAPGAGYFDISTRGIDCAEAKTLILTAAAPPDFAKLPPEPWTCENLGASGESVQYRCENSEGRAIRWWIGA